MIDNRSTTRAELLAALQLLVIDAADANEVLLEGALRLILRATQIPVEHKAKLLAAGQLILDAVGATQSFGRRRTDVADATKRKDDK